jgi:hypothetical protein
MRVSLKNKLIKFLINICSKMFKSFIDHQYDGQSQQYSHVLNVLNIIFTALFTVEFLLKLMAFRFKVCLNPLLYIFYPLLIALNIYFF